MFKIRCSAIGKIKANGKGSVISVGAKTYVKEKAIEQLYGYTKEIDSKYIDKGNFVEEDAINYYADYKGDMYFKNEEHFENEYFTGTPDILLADRVVDIKCSWDCYTFPLFDEKIPNMDYYAQLQGYMYLTGRKHATLAYILMDTPDYIEETEVTYKNLPAKLRVKEFHFDYDPDFIADIITKVEACQEYFNELIKIKE